MPRGSKKLLTSQAIPRNSRPSWLFEEEAVCLGAHTIAGIDEAGRGPLAGPVVAAALVLSCGEQIGGLNDSKLLTAHQRAKLYEVLLEKALAIGIGIVSADQIDEINIYQATRVAMTMAVEKLTAKPDFLLIDGPISLDLPISQRSIIKGDRLCCSVAAAAIAAKVTRDGIMMELHEQYPQYGFDSHKGYPTKAHKEAIKRHGPCPVHRKCFRGVREHVAAPLFRF